MAPMGSILKSSVLLMAVAGLVACQTVQTTQGGAVGIDRKQQMLVSAQDMDAAAGKQYAEVLAQAREKRQLNGNAAQVQRVRAIANRLIPQTVAFRADARQWAWEVNVLSADEANAWCMPGGKIAVYTGLIDKLAVTDDELAAVMGHEIAHALREHARERASHQAAAGSVISIGAALLGLGDAGTQGGQYLYMGVWGLPNSRAHETEADRIGVELAARAGFDPKAAVTLWQKMARQGGQEPVKWLSTHPSSADRIADLTVYAQRVDPLYQQARKLR